jgi:hypothetical protein
MNGQGHGAKDLDSAELRLSILQTLVAEATVEGKRLRLPDIREVRRTAAEAHGLSPNDARLHRVAGQVRACVIEASRIGDQRR